MINGGVESFEKKFLARVSERKKIPACIRNKKYIAAQTPIDMLYCAHGVCAKKFLGLKNAAKFFSGSDKKPHPPDHLMVAS